MSHRAATELVLQSLLDEIRQCQLCSPRLPHRPNPVLRAHPESRILIVGQAPGARVHATGIPWNDASGKRLRRWLGVTDETFYDERQFAIIPAGFCYPGKGKNGDLPPRPECAPQWHPGLLAQLKSLRLTLLIGQYAQQYYLGKDGKNLTQRVEQWRSYLPRFMPLPHPSPRNGVWLHNNPWFEQELVPKLKTLIQSYLTDGSQPTTTRSGGRG